MNKAKASFLTVVFIAVFSVVAAAWVTSSQQRTRPNQDDATPVQRGVITEKQKKHRELYRDYKGVGNIGNTNNGQDVTVISLPGTPELSPTGQNPKNAIRELAKNADVIVIGTVTSKTSQLTEGETFVFTDYEVRVEEALKNNVSSQDTIIVTRPGGKVLLDGRVITAVDETAKPLKVGERYLMFLRRVPTTDAYIDAGHGASIQLKDNKTIALSQSVTLPSELRGGKDISTFIAEVRAAIAQAQTEGGDK